MSDEERRDQAEQASLRVTIEAIAKEQGIEALDLAVAMLQDLDRDRPCEACAGTGEWGPQYGEPPVDCPTCDGSGWDRDRP